MTVPFGFGTLNRFSDLVPVGEPVDPERLAAMPSGDPPSACFALNVSYGIDALRLMQPAVEPVDLPIDAEQDDRYADLLPAPQVSASFFQRYRRNSIASSQAIPYKSLVKVLLGRQWPALRCWPATTTCPFVGM